MKPFIAILTFFTFSCFDLPSIDLTDINYDRLVSNPYTDHVQHLEKLFRHANVNSCLEFGLGYGTKYLLEQCGDVTSCEIILPEQATDWFDHTKDLLRGYQNWTPILKHGSSSLQHANVLCSQERKDPALYNAAYLLELKDVCDELFKNKQFDMAFVDPGFHMRGDLVNELFDRVPIIVAHDTNIAPEIYGWRKIQTPSNYEKIVYAEGQGVIIWIRNDRPDLILALKSRADSLAPKKHLRIFFPQTHPVLVQSMALALQHLGHTLVLPGESFDPRIRGRDLKIAYGTFFKKNPLESASFTEFFSTSPEYCNFLSKNVEVIENHEMLSNPPDVLFVNCTEVESSVYLIYEAIKKKKARLPKLAHYSGNNGSHFSSHYVKNLIALDAYTASFYDPAKTNIICWIPWIDFETIKFQGYSDKLVLNSYIAHQYPRLPASASVFDYIMGNAKREFREVTFNSFPNPLPHQYPYVRHAEVLSLINKSCATIHIKETEGFGYTIVESIASGRPVFLKRSFSLGSRLMNWCIEGKTAFFFDDYDEFHVKLQKYIDDTDYRHQIQNECATTIRRLIDNEKQARILENFLQNLK